MSLQEPEAIVQTGVFSPIAEAFRDSLRVLATSVAALVYAAVFLLPWGLIAYLVWRLARSVRARRRATAAKASEG